MMDIKKKPVRFYVHRSYILKRTENSRDCFQIIATLGQKDALLVVRGSRSESH